MAEETKEETVVEETAAPEAAVEETKEEAAPAAEVKEEKASDVDETVEVPKEFKKLVEQVEEMTVLQLHELVKVLEKRFGVSASAVAVAGPAGGADAAEEQSEFTVELTEAETEYKVRSNARTKMCLDVFIVDFVESYQVTCTKHIFKEHVVFHFKCSNTIEDQILENVSVVMEIIEGTEAFAEVLTVPLGTMPLGQFGSTFVSYERAQVWISFLRTRPQDVNLFCNAGTLSSC